VTLGQAIVPERIAYAREPSKLPVVLSADEVGALSGGDPEPQEPHSADHRGSAKGCMRFGRAINVGTKQALGLSMTRAEF
jgi:hypothetical protein